MNARQRNKQGFTLIEVILVLAIAALIFLMIFIALPALQSSQRDTARKNDAGIVSSAVTRYTSGERTTVDAGFTADGNAIIQGYVDSLDQYEISNVLVTDNFGDNPTADQILVYAGGECDGSGVSDSGTTRKNAVRLMLDNGTSFYCVDAS